MSETNLQQRHIKLAKLTAITGQLADCLKHLHTMSQFIPPKKKIKNKVEKRTRNRTCYMLEKNLDREKAGYFVSDFQKVKMYDAEEFFQHTRMNRSSYDFLLSVMDQSQLLTKHSIRRPFSPELRLAITVHFLAQNLNTKIVAEKYKIGKETARAIIKETCESLWDTLSPIYVAEPQSQELKQITKDFYKKWKLPNCLGAIDGRHIQIKCPNTKRGTKYSSKNEHYMVLIAACNSRYEFTFVDVATHEMRSNGELSQAINFSSRLITKQQVLIPDEPFPKSCRCLSHYFVADCEFSVTSENIVKPYSGRSLTRAELYTNKNMQPAVDSIDNAFGILAARWPILQTCFQMIPESAEKIVLACVALHNFILHSSNSIPEYCPPGFADWYDEKMQKHEGEWRQLVSADFFQQIKSNPSNSRLELSLLRDELHSFFNK